MDKSKILSQLFKKGFELIQLNDFEGTEFALFRKDHIYIIVCHYVNDLDINSIEEEAKNLRNLMHKRKINAWNTYLLISFERDIEFQDLIVIERSSKSMRRYVITNEHDFNRIPFLDNIEVVSNPFEISSQTTVGNDEQIRRIIGFFQQHNGENVKIKSSTIQNKLNELFDLEG
ncbi:hypothetical protein SB775_17850 [Peribacillus sp. SIMBA_075]|uniref:ABC-three component system middle component 1 n=1 Tax=Peribacillus sp. SIMBA_075 TaxID=3085813 RepID=UPI00397E50A6